MDRTADKALHYFDQLLQDRPKRDGHDFSEATAWLSAYREELSSEWRRTGNESDRKRLRRINGVLSVVVGGHYPLGEVPWDQIERARGDLAAVIGIRDAGPSRDDRDLAAASQR